MKTLLRLCATLLLFVSPAFGAVQSGSAAPADSTVVASLDVGELAQNPGAEEAAVEETSTEEDLEANAGKVADYIAQAKDWAVEEGPGMLLKAIMFLVILFVFKILGNMMSSVVMRALKSAKLEISNLLSEFFTGAIKKIFLVIGLMIALEMVGVQTAPILAGLGVMGFVVGFALQDTLSNFAAGVMILLYRPYDIGDVITAAGETGSVKDMSLVSTIIGTPDNQRVIIPNSAIWGGTIRNVTAQDTRRVDMVIGVSYDLMVPGDTAESLLPKMRAFMERRDVDIPVWIYDADDYEQINNRFELPGEVPVTLAIDREGKIVDREEGPASEARFDEMMRKALGI